MVKCVAPEKIRDVRIMARRGESFAFIRDMVGWTDDVLRDVLQVNGIVVAGMPEPSPRRGISTAPFKTSHPDRPRSPEARAVTIAAVTTPTLDQAVIREAKRRGLRRGGLLHAVIDALERRGLWAALLDSESSSVASACPSQNNEQN